MKTRPNCILLCLALVGTAASALAAEPSPRLPFYKQFANWLIACDNGGRCEAKGFAEDDDNNSKPVVMRVARDAGPQAGVQLSLEAEVAFSEKDLSIDGRPGLRDGDIWVALPANQGIGWAARDPRSARQVLQTLRNAATLKLGQAGSVSLSGMNAALLAMDEAQGRLGTTTALIRAGNAPASTVAHAPTLPAAPVAARPPPALAGDVAKTIVAAVRTNQKSLLASAECSPEASDGEAFALTADEALVMIGCWRGPYQSSSLLFRASPREPASARQIVLTTPALAATADTRDASGSLIDPDFDPAKGKLSSSERGRGPADCGSTATWVFDGRQFQLESYSYQDMCRGLKGDWPTLWRTAANAVAPEAPKTDRRCGWYLNTTPGNTILLDKDASWSITSQGRAKGSNAEGAEINGPVLDPKQSVETAPGYGYGCACLTVETDARTSRITKVISGESRPLLRCRSDKSLPKPN